jgi:hypothetical protein
LDIQLIELRKVYKILGTQSMQTNHKVSFYNKVSYIIRDHAQLTDENEGIIQGHAQLTTGNDDGICLEMQKVVIKTGDIIEFLDTSPDSFHGQGFGRVAAIMVHEWTVFLIIIWITATG